LKSKEAIRLSKIANLYIPFLKDFHIQNIDSFTERFYQRMSKERFEGILRGYRIVPSQHRERYVIEALNIITTARNETHTSRPSESLENSMSSAHEISIPEAPAITYDDGQIRVFRDTISQIDEMLLDDIDIDKRQRLLSKREHIIRRIQSSTIPERQEEATIIVDEDSNCLSLT
jgi:hypothetical protein